MNFVNMRVASKLWMTILGLLLAMSVCSIVVQTITARTLVQSRLDVQAIDRKIALAQHMRGNIMRTVEVATAQIATNEPRLQNEFTKRLADRLKETTASMDAMRAALVSELDRQKFEALIAAFEHSKQLRVKAEADMDVDDFHARSDFAFGAYSQSIEVYYAAVGEFLDLQQAQLQEVLAAADSAQARSTYTGWILVAVLLALGMCLAHWIVKSITQPLQKAVQFSQAIGAGHLAIQVEIDRRDEFGDLLRALEMMAKRLCGVIAEVRQGVEAVSSAAGQIASGNQDLSARTEQTAANLQQTAASVEEMSASVNQAADTSRQANQLAATAVQAAERGGEVVQQVVQSMEQINTSSRKISDIIGVIDGIAFQTNILALNAAVEAARAGEQGRGFAVVAGEVRTLAQRSAEAAKEIKGLITASVGNVDMGAAQVAQAGQSMEEIVSSVRRVTDLIGEITASASEQSEGFGQVNTAVSNLDQMTQQNAALVEESSAAANAMNDQALRLLQLVSGFNVGSSAHASTGYARESMAAAPVAAKPARTVAAVAPKARAAAPVAAVKPAAAAVAAKPVAAQPAKVSSDDDWETF